MKRICYIGIVFAAISISCGSGDTSVSLGSFDNGQKKLELIVIKHDLGNQGTNQDAFDIGAETSFQKNCIDQDNDGYGDGCSMGLDCDDSDPLHFNDCSQCSNISVPGCLCSVEGQKIDCFGGDWKLVGIGQCKSGAQICKDGVWSKCIGEVLPTNEVCDLKDNDCDGLIDEDFPLGCGTELCLDLDGDGFGNGCGLGPDCDDTNPNFHKDCPSCGDEPKGGCPCSLEGVSYPCYSGDMALLGIGACKAGNIRCENGFWTDCIGEVLPQLEICDGKDNDCDGKTDEGVLNECGNCDPVCFVKETGPNGDEPFKLGGGNSEGVVLTPEGWLTLSESSYYLHFIWISNSKENTVSKLDTITGKELGRYDVCSDPSRTTVDKNGDGWIACRGDGRIVKIRNVIEKCPDKNNDGVISTSTDLDNDGTIQPNEMVQDDECVLFKVQPEGSGGYARALGSDAQGYAWAGFWNPSTIHKLHPTTGQSMASKKLPANPYGIAIDSKGVIWVSGRGGNLLVRVDPNTLDVKSFKPDIGCFEPYGITVDEFDRPWVANCCCANVAYVFDPVKGKWGSVGVHARPRGIASNRKGFVFVANDESDEVARINISNYQVSYGSLGAGRFPIGMAVDSNGYVWAVNQSSSSASKIDPNTMAVQLEKKVGKNPYTYSDMTGSLFFDSIAPQGHYRLIFEGPDLDEYSQEWYEVVWETLFIDHFSPQGSYIEVRARTSDKKEELDKAQWSQVYGPCPPKGFPIEFHSFMGTGSKGKKWIEIEVTLYSGENTKPFVKGIKVQFGVKWKGD